MSIYRFQQAILVSSIQNMANILVVDGDQAIGNIVAAALEKAGHNVVRSTSGYDAMEILKTNIYDIIIAELEASGPNGTSMLRAAKNAFLDAEVIMMTGYGATETAVEAMKLGAWRYVVKPLSLQQLVLIVNRALEKRQLVASVKHLREQVVEKYRFVNIIGDSEKMLRAVELANKASTIDSPILITGESGTGKQLIGKTIHTTRTCGREPFIPIDLSAVGQEIMELALFGSVGGAATGNTRNVRGTIERADRGTIFLNEITAVPLGLQERLLELFEYDMVSRMGSQEMIYVNTRPIVSCSANIEEHVRHGKFRDDLFHLLSRTWIHLPPLKERKDDIPLLAHHFVSKYSEQFDKQIHGVSEESLSFLTSYDWPGNVRELENAIERAVFFTSEGIISLSSLPYPVQVSRNSSQPPALKERV